MPLDKAALTAVRELLKDCAVAVTGVDGEHGSGFFVDEHLVLTCAHVVAGPRGSHVKVRPLVGEREGEVVEYLPGDDKDLALIEVKRQPKDPPQPAVALDLAVEDNERYFAVGFPREELLGKAGLEEIAFEVNATHEDDRVTARFLNLQSGGATVRPGLSGGALLNPRSGGVVGIVQYTHDATADSGGGAIPIRRGADLLPTIKKLLDSPPLATRRWRDALGVDAWHQLGNDWAWSSQLDLVISGTLEEWSVCLDPKQGGEVTLTGERLPGQVARALFHWAQRRRVRDPEDVALLGRLLGGALMPEDLDEQIARSADSDDLFVRLRFDAVSDLFDVPWEFARIKGSAGERVLAADKHTRLSRVAPRADGSHVDLAPRRAPAGVLGIVVQPEDWQAQMTRSVGGREVTWPEGGGLKKRLEQATSTGTFAPEVLETPVPAEVTTALGRFESAHGTRADVVHYLGFGEEEGGRAKISFSDDDGGAEPRNLDDLFEWTADAGARLLVVQFLMPRLRADPDPLPPRDFLPALRGSIAAVVFTRFPIHPRQVYSFNRVLYEHLGRGDTIEEAVQAGRVDAEGNRPLEDAAGFGWFGLLTGPESGLRLLEPGSSGGGGRGPASASGRE